MAEGQYKNTSEELQNECDVNAECDPCKDDGIKLTAEGFCVDCNDYLCKPCYRNHKIPRPLKHHVLQDKYSMPPVKPVGKNVPCWIHKSEFVTQYCKTHDEVSCGVCKIQSHLECVTMDISPALVKNVRKTLEFYSCLESVSASIEGCKEDKQQIDCVKSNIDEHYVSTQKRIENMLMVLKDNDIRLNNSLRCTSESLQNELMSVQTKIATQLCSEEYSFINMKTAKMIVHKTREQSTLLKQKTNPTKFGFIDNASPVSRNGSTHLLWTANNDYSLIPIDTIKRENTSMAVIGITGHSDMIYALLQYSYTGPELSSDYHAMYERGQDETTYHIITVNSYTGRVEETTNLALRTKSYVSPMRISYSNYGLLVAATMNSGHFAVTVYRKAKGVGSLYKADTVCMGNRMIGKLVGQSVICKSYYPGRSGSTLLFQKVGDREERLIEINNMYVNLIYHDTDSRAFLSFCHETMKLFDEDTIKLLGEKQTGIENDITTVVKYANKFYILWSEIGVFECNSKNLSDWCQIIQITDSIKYCQTMAVNDCHICLAPTQDGLIAVFKKP